MTNTKSRILETGDNQVSYPYRLHVSNKKTGRGWALGIDIVKYKSQIDYITAHSLGTVIKCVNYLSGTNGVPDREGMGYGNYIILRHSDTLCTVYAHLEKVYVREGDTVMPGTRIGLMGNTGSSHGAHLHWELRNYKSPIKTSSSLNDERLFTWLDPTRYINASLPIRKKYSGFIDNISGSSVSGWLWNGIDDAAEYATVRLLRSGTVVKTFSGKASSYRSDLAVSGKGNGYHAYDIHIDSSTLPSGTYTVDVIAPDGTVLGYSSPDAPGTINVSARSYTPGSAFRLSSVPVYNAETGPSIGVRSGTYYIHSLPVSNGRIRMTNLISRVGKPGQVSFWMEISKL